jgi:hypothetical protein
MNGKCVEYLAFVDAKTGRIKERFEIEFTEKELLEGRRPQLIKKIIAKAVKEKWVKGWQLFKFMKKSNTLTTYDLLTFAFADEVD